MCVHVCNRVCNGWLTAPYGRKEPVANGFYKSVFKKSHVMDKFSIDLQRWSRHNMKTFSALLALREGCHQLIGCINSIWRRDNNCASDNRLGALTSHSSILYIRHISVKNGVSIPLMETWHWCLQVSACNASCHAACVILYATDD